ncbi:hypothetical protein B0H11DRAFT_2034479 [Mycena galericulata]|nr:hypothetical protein B0H11DRAFT_2034479 [Mycena galericulata]
MGRWTVAEWQAQAQQYSRGPLPGGMEELGYKDEVYPFRISTVLDDEEGGFEDEDEDDYGGKGLPPLPARPRIQTGACDDRPPTPPPKMARVSNALRREGYVDKIMGVVRKTGAKGKKEENSVAGRIFRPRKGGPEFMMVTPGTASPVRSKDGHRHREFSAGSGLKRTKSKAKSSVASKPTAQRTDGYTYNGQGLQIFVSTQTTAIPSGPDAGRPRVFYPRSSSLAAMSGNVLPPLPPKPPKKALETSRALPAVPARRVPDAPNSHGHRRGSSKGSISRSPRRIRPLPIPKPTS